MLNIRLARRVGALSAATALFGVTLVLAPIRAGAQPYAVPPTWGGDFLSRPRLTGDWGGLRDELGAKGVVLDVDLLVTPMDVWSGGKNTGGDTWGNADYTLNLDTQKLGLWPGGFLKISVDTSFGTAVNNSGAIIPIDTAYIVPAPNDRATTLMNATFMQFLSAKLGVLLGKINMLDAAEQEFYGDYRTQFLNTAFNFPMTTAFAPISAFGGGAIVLPTPDLTMSVLALGSNNTPTDNDVGDAFSQGTVVLGSGAMTIKPYGLVGHQSASFLWSSQDRFSLEQDPANLVALRLQNRFPRLDNPGPILADILARYFPNLIIPASPPNQESSSWALGYAFDQYLWQPPGDPKHGVGVFFSFGVSDGNPNPIKYAFLAGIGGKGVPGRPDDSYGLGFARTQFSGAFVPLLRERLGLGLDHENAFELYYNLALTGWLSITPDLQVVNPGLKRTLNPTGTGLMNVDTATIAGVRFRVRF